MKGMPWTMKALLTAGSPSMPPSIEDLSVGLSQTSTKTMFASAVGVPEDPATGSANGTLGAYLVFHGAVPVEEGTNHFVSEQAAEMGRPSTVHVLVDTSGGEIARVRVAGHVVPVVEGVVRF